MTLRPLQWQFAAAFAVLCLASCDHARHPHSPGSLRIIKDDRNKNGRNTAVFTGKGNSVVLMVAGERARKFVEIKFPKGILCHFRITVKTSPRGPAGYATDDLNRINELPVEDMQFSRESEFNGLAHARGTFAKVVVVRPHGQEEGQIQTGILVSFQFRIETIKQEEELPGGGYRNLAIP